MLGPRPRGKFNEPPRRDERVLSPSLTTLEETHRGRPPVLRNRPFFGSDLSLSRSSVLLHA